MIVSTLYEYSVVNDDNYTYIASFEWDYHPNVCIKQSKEWMRTKFVKELLKQGIIVDKIKELC